MQNGIRQTTIRRDTPQTSGSMTASVAAEIGPRAAGTVYYDGPRTVEVQDVITDPSEARRILRRNAAQYAIHVVDLHAGTEYYTGAVWTGSDRVIKAVA